MSNKHFEQHSKTENEEHKPKNTKIAKLMMPELTAVLERTRTSNRETVFAIAATASSLAHNFNDLTLSISTVCRARRYSRKKLAKKDKQEFNQIHPLLYNGTGNSCQCYL